VTTEQKTFISFGDLLALEFRCKAYRSSVTRPLKDWRQAPAVCGNCRAQWFTDGSEEHHLLEASVNMVKRMATADEGAKYVLRVEIKIGEQVKVHGSYSAT